MGLYIIYTYLEWKHFTPRGRRKLCFSHKWENKFMFFFIQGLIFVHFLKKKKNNGKILDARQVKTFNRTNLSQ